MNLCTLASGSKGNSSIICTENSRFLVDIGISTKRLKSSLDGMEIDISSLSGIFITHEHRDHIAGLKTFVKKYEVPIFATSGTFDAILKTCGYEGIDTRLLHSIEKSKEFFVGNTRIKAFEIPHDAGDPVGFTFREEDKKVAVCTDIGMITDCIIEHLEGSNALVIEANHDEHILQAGNYPYSLKKRILSDRGHLSNENSGRLLSKIWNKNLQHIVLGHLSEENNMPDLALMSVKYELMEKFKNFEQFTDITVAEKAVPSKMILV